LPLGASIFAHPCKKSWRRLCPSVGNPRVGVSASRPVTIIITLSAHTASFKCLYFNVYVCLVSSQNERYYDDVSMNVAGRQRLNQICHVRHGTLHTVAHSTAAHLSICCCRSSWCCVRCKLTRTLRQGLKGNRQSANNRIAKWTSQSWRPLSVARSRAHIIMHRFHTANTQSMLCRSCRKTSNIISSRAKFQCLQTIPLCATRTHHLDALDSLRDQWIMLGSQHSALQPAARGRRSVNNTTLFINS